MSNIIFKQVASWDTIDTVIALFNADNENDNLYLTPKPVSLILPLNRAKK